MDRRASRRLACTLASLLLAAAPPPAAGPDPYREVSLALAHELIALFPAAEGYVVSANGGKAYIDLSRKNLLRPGMELQVYRPGGEMIHPVTKQPLGSFEKHLGFLHLIDVRDKYSRGTLDADGAAAGIVTGDRVRMSARRMRVLLHVGAVAAGIQVGPLAQALLARGEESGRFAMIDEPAWAPALSALRVPWESVRADPAALRRLGESAAADLLWLVRVDTGAIVRVSIEVRSLHTGAVLADLGRPWPAVSPAPPPPAAAAAAAEVDEYTVRELMSPARSLAAGDILGEGRLEVLLTDGSRLALYRWEPKTLVWRWDEDGPTGRQILSLDAADLDGEGPAEVLVTTLRRGRVFSEIRRWRDGALQVVARSEDLYLRAVPRAGRTVLLLGQRAGIDEVLSGRVEQYRLRDGSLDPVGSGSLPVGVDIFGVTPAPVDGPVGLYALDHSGRIFGLSREGAVLWRSALPYGGHPLPLSAREFFGTGLADERDFDRAGIVFKGRLLTDRAPAGVRLIVPNNVTDPPGDPVRLRTPGHGEVVILQGSPTNPEEVRRSRAFDGYVADLARGDVEADGKPEIIFVVNRFAGPLLGVRGKIVLWRPVGAPTGTPIREK